jgi:hypothetical protein
LGGIGGGLIVDWLSMVGGRYWLTAGELVMYIWVSVSCFPLFFMLSANFYVLGQ